MKNIYMYIGILVTSTTTGPGGSVVSALLHKQEVKFPALLNLYQPISSSPPPISSLLSLYLP